MHDWVLLKIGVEWSKGELVISLVDARSTPVEIKASGMRAFRLERSHAWGESSSLYEAIGPVYMRQSVPWKSTPVSPECRS